MCSLYIYIDIMLMADLIRSAAQQGHSTFRDVPRTFPYHLEGLFGWDLPLILYMISCAQSQGLRPFLHEANLAWLRGLRPWRGQLWKTMGVCTLLRWWIIRL
jgi:hypothetical protein